MVGDHAVTGLLSGFGLGMRQFFGRLDQRAKCVGVVIVMDALQNRRNSLQPHACVDRRLGQARLAAVVMPFKLHENEIPDLDITVAIFIGASGRTTENMVAVVVEDFAARAARAGVTHRPEIVVGGDTYDAFFGQTGYLAPKVKSLIVGVIDRHSQAVRVEPPRFGEQGPGMGNRLFLEIIAERKIAQHFKKGVVTCGVADIVEIIMFATCADTFLTRCSAGNCPAFKTSENVFEWHHASIDEHQRRIVIRDKRRRLDHVVARGAEMIEKCATDIVG